MGTNVITNRLIKYPLPISAVVATRNRVAALQNTLASLAVQGTLPAELIVVDASDGLLTKQLIEDFRRKVNGLCFVRWISASVCGAAAQRNEGIASTAQPFVWFFDDDVRFEPGCLARLWAAMQLEPKLGGVSAMIVNQSYHSPGAMSRAVFRLLHGKKESSYAGRVLGPAVNLLPQDREDLAEIVPVEWLNTTCTMYRRDALPSPAFDAIFTGYSLMEDLALSLRVGHKWPLANVRKARIFHDSQPEEQKLDPRTIAAMELVNRHYVMTKVLGRTRYSDYARLILWEAFQFVVGPVRDLNVSAFQSMLCGKLGGFAEIRKLGSDRSN